MLEPLHVQVPACTSRWHTLVDGTRSIHSARTRLWLPRATVATLTALEPKDHHHHHHYHHHYYYYCYYYYYYQQLALPQSP